MCCADGSSRSVSQRGSLGLASAPGSGVVKIDPLHTIARACVLVILSCCTFGSGCNVVQDAAKTSWGELRYQATDRRIRRRIRRWAEEALREHVRLNPNGRLPTEYTDGFTEGFERYVMSGCGTPPPVPPARYQSARYVSPQGAGALHNWYMGYEAGVSDARARRVRQLVILPTRTGVYVPWQAAQWADALPARPLSPTREVVPLPAPEMPMERPTSPGGAAIESRGFSPGSARQPVVSPPDPRGTLPSELAFRRVRSAPQGRAPAYPTNSSLRLSPGNPARPVPPPLAEPPAMQPVPQHASPIRKTAWVSIDDRRQSIFPPTNPEWAEATAGPLPRDELAPNRPPANPSQVPRRVTVAPSLPPNRVTLPGAGNWPEGGPPGTSRCVRAGTATPRKSYSTVEW